MSSVPKIAFSGTNFSPLGEGIGERKVEFCLTCFSDQLTLLYPNERSHFNLMCLKIF